jgi:hypothetical protein
MQYNFFLQIYSLMQLKFADKHLQLILLRSVRAKFSNQAKNLDQELARMVMHFAHFH